MRYSFQRLYCNVACPPTPTILFCVFVSLLSCSNQAVIKLPGNESIPAVFIFGDSIVDTGNNNNLNTIVKCNFPPYGRDFMGGIPTGRFSNGKVPPDMIAEELGIKDLLPPYLDPNLQNSDLPTGVTFASGGAGFDPLTSSIMLVISLPDQLRMFKEYKRKLRRHVGKKKATTIVANSLYIVAAGSDDIVNTYFYTPFRRLMYNVSSYTDFIANSASEILLGLYALGARRIGVLAVPPLGCMPSQRTLGGGRERECVEESNQATQMFNAKLLAQLNDLNSHLPQAKMVYLDGYNSMLDIVQNPGKYGFEVANIGCCGTGFFEVGFMCNQFDVFTCKNVSKYVFWDSYHPTEKTYKVLVQQALKTFMDALFGSDSPSTAISAP